MNDSAPLTGGRSLPHEVPAQEGSKPIGGSVQWRRFGLAAGILVLCFAVPLWNLARFAATSEFRSYILVVPFISGYLIWLKRQSLPVSAQPARAAAGVFLAAGLATIALYWLGLRPRLRLPEADYLGIIVAAFLLCLCGVCSLFWGKETLRAAAFPLVMLIFMVPIPSFAMPAIDAFLQRGSADAAAGFFWLSGMPFFRNNLSFQLPAFSLRVAPECSGIQSTMALFIASLVGGHLFLRGPWKRVALALFVIPLALLRNGFRVFVIGELCVNISPNMINSPIHRRGGPLFFGLSLIPFFALLLLLRWFETKAESRKQKAEAQLAAFQSQIANRKSQIGVPPK